MSSGLEIQGGELRVSHYGLSRREEQFLIFKMVTEDPPSPAPLAILPRRATNPVVALALLITTALYPMEQIMKS